MRFAPTWSVDGGGIVARMPGGCKTALRMSPAGGAYKGSGVGFFERCTEYHVVVEQGGDDAADDRADPVDAPVVPEATGQGGAELPSGIHRRASQRPAQQNVHHHREADAEAADFRGTHNHTGADPRQNE